MTNQHPITPPPELVQQWVAEIWHEGTPVRVAASDLHIATQAARWGADQELEACCEYLRKNVTEFSAGAHLCAQRKSDELRTVRRPKPPTLKEQALDAWDRLRNEAWCEEIDYDLDFIRRALEQLDD